MISMLLLITGVACFFCGLYLGKHYLSQRIRKLIRDVEEGSIEVDIIPYEEDSNVRKGDVIAFKSDTYAGIVEGIGDGIKDPKYQVRVWLGDRHIVGKVGGH